MKVLVDLFVFMPRSSVLVPSRLVCKTILCFGYGFIRASASPNSPTLSMCPLSKPVKTSIPMLASIARCAQLYSRPSA
jgi:hypothetical protein